MGVHTRVPVTAEGSEKEQTSEEVQGARRSRPARASTPTATTARSRPADLQPPSQQVLSSEVSRTSVLSVYKHTVLLAIAYLSGDWEKHASETKTIGAAFKQIPVGQNLMLNLLTWVPFIMLLNRLAGLSVEYQSFIFCWSLGPMLLAGSFYYYHTYGAGCFAITWGMVMDWLNNWLAVTSIAMVSFTQMVVHYFGLLLLEPLLPAQMQGVLSFPQVELEKSLQVVVKMLAVLGLLHLVTLPLWVRGYKLSREIWGRPGGISSREIAIELLYTSSQAAAGMIMQLPLALIQMNWGYPFHIVHFAAGFIEGALLNIVVKFKYAWLHKLTHETRPLHHMSHIEHHVCKTVFCTTPAAGLWEVWIEGGTLFYCNSLSTIPYLYFHLLTAGPNVIAHSMWPVKCMIQWHTFHHVAHADIYAVNIPSANDEEFSRDVKKYKSVLEEMSPFVRYSWLSDAAGFALALASGFVLHKVFGIGLLQVWEHRVWL